jgi:RNA polymerase sigma-70 factor (ECF subfamily)
VAATGQRHPRTIDAGQQAAELDIGALYDQYSQHVYRLCLRRLHSREDAADSVQETFLNAWRALDRGAVVASPLAWLLRIADNVCVNRFRAQRSRVAETQLQTRSTGSWMPCAHCRRDNGEPSSAESFRGTPTTKYPPIWASRPRPPRHSSTVPESPSHEASTERDAMR